MLNVQKPNKKNEIAVPVNKPSVAWFLSLPVFFTPHMCTLTFGPEVYGGVTLLLNRMETKT